MAKKKQRKPNKSYTLEACKRKHDYRILSCDPGTRNFGISCVGVKNGRPDVIASALLEHPITQLTSGFMAQRDLYSNELRRWIELYDPDVFIAERFQTRGNGGPTIELVSVMIAFLGIIRKKPIKYVVASQWKNDFNKHHGEGDKEFLKGLYSDCLATPHQLDASLIGIYGLETALQRKLVYKPDQIIRQVESTSRMDLRKPRK